MAKVEITNGIPFEGQRTICTAHYPRLVDQIVEAFDTHDEAIAFREYHLAKGANVGSKKWEWQEVKADIGFWRTHVNLLLGVFRYGHSDLAYHLFRCKGFAQCRSPQSWLSSSICRLSRRNSLRTWRWWRIKRHDA